MIRLYLLLIFILFSISNSAQESPKNIISNEKKTLLIEENIETQENIIFFKSIFYTISINFMIYNYSIKIA